MTPDSQILSSVNFSPEAPRFFFPQARWRFTAKPSAPVANCIDLTNYDHYETVISSIPSRGGEEQITVREGRLATEIMRCSIARISWEALYSHQDESALRNGPSWMLVWWVSPAHTSTINLNKNISSLEKLQCSALSWLIFCPGWIPADPGENGGFLTRKPAAKCISHCSGLETLRYT